jgi:uncharacterized protein with HEPN domain
MQPETARYLRDMLDAARATREQTDNRSVDDYLQHRWLRDASNWNFCVIGEALSQLKRIDDATALRITDCVKIIGLRNQLIHGYGVINDRITWNIIETKLPVLIRELSEMLGA